MFETGYGPSGLPHIGTFGEVARTTMVRHAFRVLTDDAIQTRLIAFSDDMDGLRKVPDNIPNREMVAPHLGKPLTRCPIRSANTKVSPRTTTRGCARFLDGSASTTNSCPRPNITGPAGSTRRCCTMLARFDEVQAIMLPTLREERAATYSPFLPIHPRTGVVMQVPLCRTTRRRARSAGAIPQTDEEFETPVTGGKCKLQWKPDWAMRWYALGVDYEMAGKDLINSVKLSSQIVRALGGEPPAGLQLRAVPRRQGPEDLQVEGQRPHHRGVADLRQPRKPVAVHVPEADGGEAAPFRRDPANRRRLSRAFWRPIRSRNGRSGSAIPSGMFIPASRRRPRRWRMATRRRPRSPSRCCSIWPPSPTATIRRCCGASCAATRPPRRRENHPRLDRLVHYAVAYFRDFVAPKKRYRAADEVERAALEKVSAQARRDCRRGASAEDIQHALYDIARPIPRYQDMTAKGATPERPGVSNEFFNMVYAVLLGEERGPRLGSFIALYGLEETRALIAKALAGELVRGQVPALS